jgi:D-arginine dehydrogenase
MGNWSLAVTLWSPVCSGWLRRGGYGIQSAAGASQLAASLLLGQPLPDELRQHGVDPAAVSPARLSREG